MNKDINIKVDDQNKFFGTLAAIGRLSLCLCVKVCSL